MKQIITLFLVITSFCFSQEFWEPTNGPLGSLNRINSIVINYSQEKFVATSHGIYRCSSDLENLTKVYHKKINLLAINSSNEIYAASDTSVYHTSDNGGNWTEILRTSDAPVYPSIRDIAINSNDEKKYLELCEQSCIKCGEAKRATPKKNAYVS